jgi:hypothetical protein
MGLKNTVQPRLPAAPNEYERQYMEKLINVLRLYFNQLDNAAPAIFASQNIGSITAPVVSALTCAQPDPAVPGAFKVSLPTQADLANLRAGDIYYDTTAGNVLKIKV